MTFEVQLERFLRQKPCYYFSIGYQRDNAVRRDYSGNTTFQFRFGISIDGQHY